MGAIVGFLVGGGTVALAIIVYWALYPDRAEKLAGQVVAILARIFGGLNKAAVAMRVQGAINSARTELLRDAPPELIEEKLKIRWTDTDEAAALLRQGEVLVVMQPANHHEENVAHAVMSYLPKALLPRARRYVDPDRMRAADLVMARAILTQEGMSPGALPIFFKEHFDPARARSETLEEKVAEVDEIDLQGWLTRFLLPEYQLLGDELHPGEPSVECLRDAEEFARFVSDRAKRELGDTSLSRVLRTQHFRVAIIFVALRYVLEAQGLDPYLKRTKRYLFRDKLDAVYLMAYDKNIHVVEQLADALEGHGWVAGVDRYRYQLRNDFKKRKGLNRDEAIAVCVRRRKTVDTVPDDDYEESDSEALEIPEEVFPAVEATDGEGSDDETPPE